MDPEELRRILIHADVFAFGVLISEILTGCSECKMYKGDKESALDNISVHLLTTIKNSGDGTSRGATDSDRTRR